MLSDEQKLYIKNNCLAYGDEEIAKGLGVSRGSVQNYRINHLGVKKNSGKARDTALLAQTLHENPQLIASAGLTPAEREKFFKLEFKNSVFFKSLKEQLTDDEIKFYLEEWGSLCVQFEDIVSTEKRQIDEYIKCEIYANRIQKRVKFADDEIESMAQRLEEKRKTVDLSNDENAQLYDEDVTIAIRSMATQMQVMSNDYLKIVATKNQILENLNGRRKDRMMQLEKSKTTFIGLVQAIKDADVKNIQGRYAELVRQSKENKKKLWRNKITFPDGSSDYVLMDEHHNSEKVPTPKTDKVVEKILQDKKDELDKEQAETTIESLG